MPEPNSVLNCPSCGKANSGGNKFCFGCGASLIAPERRAAAPSERSVDSAMVNCPACSAVVPAGNRFCLSCGALLAAAGPATIPFASPAAEPTLAVPVVTLEPSPVDTAADYHASPAEIVQPGPFGGPGQNVAKFLLIVVVALVIVGAAGWYAWKYFAGPDVTVAVIPQRIHVAPGGKTALQASVTGSADTDVTWSVQEGSKGGEVTPLGAVMAANRPRASAIYSAPHAAGTFHVIATSHANPKRTAQVEVIVGGAAQRDIAPAAGAAANSGAAQIAGVWRWPSGDMRMTITAASTITVTSDSDPQKNLSGSYRFTDSSHVEVNFGNGDVRTWQILGVDGNYLRVLSQAKTESSLTALVFVRIG